jgi:2-iminobutanoate/2-iminopropanoate deaminase
MSPVKKVVRSAVPETGGPFNLGLTYGPLLFVSGLPPFDEAYARAMREARARGERPPPYVPAPFDEQVRIVMDHLKAVVEAAGSNMDCLLKVIVWLKDQTKAEAFDRIYRTYFSSTEALPTRTRMQAGRTPMDCELEVEAIGYVPAAGWGAPAPAKRAARKRPAGKRPAKRRARA